METKQLTKNTNLPLLGLGTWQMGGRLEADHSNDAQEIAAIKEAIKLGYTHIDTAEMYGDGHSEELIAQAIKDVDRNQLFITSKVTGDNCAYDDVIASCKASLKRLQIDYLDLYLIHFPSHTIPFRETFDALHKLQSDGLIKNIGVSNFTVDDLKEALKHTNKIVCNQIQYSLVARNHGRYMHNMERDIIPFCKEHGIHIVAWRPLEYGKLADPDKFPTFHKLTRKYNKTAAQIAINWLFCKDVFTIVKSSNKEHLKENLGSMDWRLEKQDVVLLDEEFSTY